MTMLRMELATPRMRRLLAILTVVAMVGVACDAGEPEVEAPETVETCDGLVDVGEQLIRAYVQVLERTDVGELVAETPNENLDELRRIGDELDVRAAGLGCDAADLQAAVVAATDDLEPTTPNVEMLLDVLRADIGDPAGSETGASTTTVTPTTVATTSP